MFLKSRGEEQGLLHLLLRQDKAKVVKCYEGSGHMANFITSLRIICSIALLFCLALSPAFYALYIVAGFTDMIDGAVARKTNTVSEFGSRLDTVADFFCCYMPDKVDSCIEYYNFDLCMGCHNCIYQNNQCCFWIHCAEKVCSSSYCYE